MHNHKSCAECAHSAFRDNDRDIECRAHSPVQIDDFIWGAWPRVSPDWWCAEFERSHEVDERELT